jgi:hypothetical protein
MLIWAFLVLWFMRREYDWYNNLVCLIIHVHPFFGPHAVWYVSYQSLSRSWHSDLEYGSYRLSNFEIGLTAGVTARQGMLTPPWYLIPLLIYSEVSARPFSDLYFLYRICEIDSLLLVHYLHHILKWSHPVFALLWLSPLWRGLGPSFE